MLTPRTTLSRRITAALDASRIAVVVGGSGSGRTTLLQQLRDRFGRTAAQYIDVERTATTPERFQRAIASVTPFPNSDASSPAEAGARPAFDTTMAFLGRARTAASEPATFLLDEFLELRTFESFPGLRRVLHDFIDGLSASSNRFVLSSRYVARALRLLRDRAARFEIIPMPQLTAEDTHDILGPTQPGSPDDGDYLARTVNSLSDGRPSYTRALADELAILREQGPGGPGGSGGIAGPGSNNIGSDPISALVSLLSPDGRLAKECGFCYELRLHRARGYGALKAILEIL